MDQQIINVTVAALLDTGTPQQVRDFVEDLAAVLGGDEARKAVYWSLLGYRFSLLLRGGFCPPQREWARQLCEELKPGA